MKRRILVGWLMAALLLCGCQGGEPGHWEQPYVTQVYLSINPELVLYLDSNDQVVSVECLNADAEAVCKDQSFSGRTFDDCLTTILDQSFQKGFLQDGKNITVSVTGMDGAVDEDTKNAVVDQASTVFSAFSHAQQISFAVVMDVNDQTVIADTVEPDSLPEDLAAPGDDDVEVEPIYDADGNQIGYREVTADGVTVEVLQYPDGTVRQYRFSYPDGFVEITNYTPAGDMESRSLTFPNGITSTTYYTSEGKPAHMEEYGPDGSLLERLTWTYDPADPLHYTQTNLAGMRTEVYCNADGTKNKCYTYHDSGETWEEQYESDMLTYKIMKKPETGGTEIWEEWYTGDQINRRKIISADTEVTEEHYENGVIVSKHFSNAHGVRSETAYANGLPTVTNWTAPDGEVWKTLYENGVQTEESGTMGDGTTWKRLYTGGVLTWSRRDATDGTYWEEHYTEQGVVVYETFYHTYDNTGYTITYTLNPNGTHATSTSVDLNGTVFVTTYDGNGNPVSWRGTDAAGNESHGIFGPAGEPIPQ